MSPEYKIVFLFANDTTPQIKCTPQTSTPLALRVYGGEEDQAGFPTKALSNNANKDSEGRDNRKGSFYDKPSPNTNSCNTHGHHHFEFRQYER